MTRPIDLSATGPISGRCTIAVCDTAPAAISGRAATPKPHENALRVLLSIGGSTNGIVHLTAIASRLGIDIHLAGLDRISREPPVLVDLKPSGQHYMEDFRANA